MNLANCKILLVILGLALISTNVFAPTSLAETAKPYQQKGYDLINWDNLIPEDDLDALLNPPEELSAIPDGSLEDIISNQISNAIDQAGDSRYQQALISTNIRPEYNNRKVKIPGFIVPLEFSENQNVTSFFLVPYFGACIHVPPPPPNQIIYGEYPKGFRLESLYDPFWLEGTLTTDVTALDLGTSAYTMAVDNILVYEE